MMLFLTNAFISTVRDVQVQHRQTASRTRVRQWTTAGCPRFQPCGLKISSYSYQKCHPHRTAQRIRQNAFRGFPAQCNLAGERWDLHWHSQHDFRETNWNSLFWFCRKTRGWLQTSAAIQAKKHKTSLGQLCSFSLVSVFVFGCQVDGMWSAHKHDWGDGKAQSGTTETGLSGERCRLEWETWTNDNHSVAITVDNNTLLTKFGVVFPHRVKASLG